MLIEYSLHTTTIDVSGAGFVIIGIGIHVTYVLCVHFKSAYCYCIRSFRCSSYDLHFLNYKFLNYELIYIYFGIVVLVPLSLTCLASQTRI